MKKENANQLIRKDGRDCFVEILLDAFPIERVHLKFVSYNAKRQAGDRISGDVDIYIPFSRFLALVHDLYEGDRSLAVSLAKASRENDSPAPWFEIVAQGGTSAADLARKSRSRADGACEARVLKIGVGSKLPVLLKAEKGAGRQSGTGLIVPTFGAKPDVAIMVGLSAMDAKELFLTARAYIEAYIASGIAERISLVQKGWQDWQKQAKSEQPSPQAKVFSQASAAGKTRSYNQSVNETVTWEELVY